MNRNESLRSELRMSRNKKQCENNTGQSPVIQFIIQNLTILNDLNLFNPIKATILIMHLL